MSWREPAAAVIRELSGAGREGGSRAGRGAIDFPLIYFRQRIPPARKQVSTVKTSNQCYVYPNTSSYVSFSPIMIVSRQLNPKCCNFLSFLLDVERLEGDQRCCCELGPFMLAFHSRPRHPKNHSGSPIPPNPVYVLPPRLINGHIDNGDGKPVSSRPVVVERSASPTETDNITEVMFVLLRLYPTFR